MNKNETQLVCVAKFVANDGEVELLKKSLFALLNVTRKEGGCLRYELNQSIDNPNTFTYLEKWYDQVTFDAHCATPYIVEFFNDGKPKYVKEFEVSLHKELFN